MITSYLWPVIWICQLFRLSGKQITLLNMLTVNNLSKYFQQGKNALQVLQHISFKVAKGETMAIVGPSGSGKTTLLGLCAGLDTPSEGELVLAGVNLGNLNEDELANIRSQYVGFIFQQFQLLPTLTALENVMVPMELKGASGIRDYAIDLLDKVGLADRFHHYPSQLSGGEQQRVALARAFSNRPQILFADEPTGNLDEETSEKVEQLIFSLNEESQTTLVLVTHDMRLARKTGRIIQLKGGRLVSDTPSHVLTNQGSN